MTVLLRRSALRVPHRSQSSDHLCPFPLCTALPCALVGRYPHEYYEHSVTLKLALRRPSRVPSQKNVIENDVGAPFMTLNAIAWHRPQDRAYHEREIDPWLPMALGMQTGYQRV
jgi:hypothetical protein